MADSKKASQEALDELHAALAKVLQREINGEEVDAATLNAARQFLKDNGISQVMSGSGDDPMANIAKSLQSIDPDGKTKPH